MTEAYIRDFVGYGANPPDPQWPKAAEAKRAGNGYLYSKPLARGKTSKGRPAHFFDWAPDNQPEPGTADYKVVSWAAGEPVSYTHLRAHET